MDVDMPPFQPSKYSLEFPFFETKDSDNYIDILGRDDVIKKINSIVDDRLNKDKYWPVIISTSRGMGKTFFLKKFGMQKIKDNLKTDIIGHAIATGRILSFDFTSGNIKNEEDVYSFFPRLMVFFLCRIFDGKQVDGINFQQIKSFNEVSTASGQQLKFKRWLLEWRNTQGTEAMIDEYIRLTNIAFGTTHDAPPVFLLDEIQNLCYPTNVISSFLRDKIPQMHSQLSLLLSQLAGKLKPVCICTGTNNGNIISITEKSKFLPQVLSLTPLVSEYEEFWKQLTDYSNKSSPQYRQVKMDSDKVLIEALVYASYQIPRLMVIAHSIWFKLRKQDTTENRKYYIQEFEKKAIDYYGEMVSVFNDFENEEIAHILLACGVHWIVENEESNVPGTKIPWANLIQKSLVFPYLDGCYLFPFSLVWRVAISPKTSNKRQDIENICAELVPNLDVKDLYISYDMLCCWENYNLGVGYETLFGSSLAVKYYLQSISTGSSGAYFSFPAVYDISSSDLPAFDIMAEYKVNFSQGISLPSREVFANGADLGFAVVHNRNMHNAHHDLILPACVSGKTVNIAVQAKASFDLSDKKTILKQLLVSPKSLEPVKQLFWLYLGKNQREKKFNSIVFLDGSGCCNGLALDFLILVKKLTSENQK